MRSLSNFFKKYGDLSTGDDSKAIADFYAETFIAAGPQSSMSFKNDKKFIAWLKQILDFNKNTGMKEMKLVKVKSTAIGDFHTNAKVTWAAGFEKTGAELFKFDITYILYHPDNNPKILMYISHEDQEEVMKKKGLI